MAFLFAFQSKNYLFKVQLYNLNILILDCSNKVPKSPAMNKQREDNNNHGAKSASLSREAQNVLDGLPLLNFMSSRILSRSRHK